MELIVAILFARPLGFFARAARTGLALTLAAWADVFGPQTVVVHLDTDPQGNDPMYWVVNAAILGAGIGLNRLGRRRRAATASPGA